MELRHLRCFIAVAEELHFARAAEQVVLARELTLDNSRPMLGLKGTYGLFGSSAWWANIEKRKIPLLFVSGTICRVY